MPETWLTRPIFISSTFRDMHAERDYLREQVFPRLEEKLRERRHHLETIDLRWGWRRCRRRIRRRRSCWCSRCAWPKSSAAGRF